MNFPAFDRRAHPAGARFSHWSAADGWRLRRMDWPQADGVAARGNLLFAGGRGDFIEKYLEPIGHWHDRGWNVTSFDWRGQGDSRGTIQGGHLESFDPLIDDFDALVAEWRAATPGVPESSLRIRVAVGATLYEGLAPQTAARSLIESRGLTVDAAYQAVLARANNERYDRRAAQAWDAAEDAAFGKKLADARNRRGAVAVFGQNIICRGNPGNAVIRCVFLIEMKMRKRESRIFAQTES